MFCVPFVQEMEVELALHRQVKQLESQVEELKNK